MNIPARRISRSKKSASRSKQPAPRQRLDSFPRSRTLKRGCSHESLLDRHLPFLWAAYSKGALSDLGDFPEGLEPGQFKDRAVAFVYTMLELGHMVDAGIAKTPEGEIPVVMFVTEVQADLLLPHAFWFPWASSRNKLECMLEYLLDLKAQNLLLINVNETLAPFFQHLGKYGILRRVGTIREWKPGVNNILFQSVR